MKLIATVTLPDLTAALARLTPSGTAIRPAKTKAPPEPAIKHRVFRRRSTRSTP